MQHAVCRSVTSVERICRRLFQRQWRSALTQFNPTVEVVATAGRSELGEGSMWWPERNTLVFVDIMRGLLNFYDPVAKKLDVHDIRKPIGTVVLRDPACERTAHFPIVLGTKDGFEEYDPENRVLRQLVSPEAHIPNNRANDGKCDPLGRFWLGTMDIQCAPGAGNLWLLERDGSVKQRCESNSFTICNGIVWSQDLKHMYFADTEADFGDSCEVLDICKATNGSLVLDLDAFEGACDGNTLDADGNIWIAHWGGGRISQWKLAGANPAQKLQEIQLPNAQQITSVAFGGPHLEDLYVTSAYIDLGDPAELIEGHPNANAGKIFRVTGHGTKGCAPNRYGPVVKPGR